MKPTANMTLTVKGDCFFSKIRSKAKIPQRLFNIILEVLATQSEQIKDLQIEKEKSIGLQMT